MSSAAVRNFGLAQRERSRRLAASMDDPGGPLAVTGDPAGDAFWGAMNEKAAAANAAGMGFRADLSGLGRMPGSAFSLSGLTPQQQAGIAGNVALGQYTDQAHAAERANQLMGEQQLAATQARIDAGQEDLANDALDRAQQVADQPGELTPQQRRDLFLKSIPGHLRPSVEARMDAMDAAKQAQQIAATKSALEVRKELAAEGSNPLLGLRALTDANGAPLTGQAALERLPAAVQNQVKGILEGRQQIPTGTATKDPYWKSIIQLANQVDPGFDATDYNARFKTRQDFTSGATARNINAINTAIGHLSDFKDKIDPLGNGSYNVLNAAKNALTPGGSSRGVALNDFNTLKNGLTSELTRVWRQAGGTEQDIKDWAATIGDTKSPEELHGALNTIGGMLESKLSALQDQYRQGMGTQGVSVISPQARQQLDKLQGSAAPVAPAGNEMVAMLAPDGRRLSVPADKVAELQAHGAKLAGR